jgi:predicted esterase
MKQYFTLALIGLFLSGCGSNSNTRNVQQEVKGGQLIFEMNAKTIKQGLLVQGWPVDERKIYGYKAYKIPYVTTDEKDNKINVSGLLVIPTELDSPLIENGLSLVSNGHGTITSTFNSPTGISEDEIPIDSALMFSSLGGFATLEADYIGYGDSRGVNHPYVMKKSLANCSIDFINAVKGFATTNAIKLNDKLFVTGYSEGGYTAMSTLKKLEESNITVTAAAPMAGPYNLNLMADTIFEKSTKEENDYSYVYALLTLNSYAQSYDHNISELINTNYVSVERLLNGFYDIDEIWDELPVTLEGEEGLLHSSFIENYQENNNYWLKQSLQENSVDNWTPKTPIKLVHCKGDDQVPYRIAEETYQHFVNNGANDIEFITPDSELVNSWNHVECYYPALEFVTEWFVEQRDRI